MPGPAFRSGPTVALCPVEEADLPFIAELRNDPDVRQGLFATPENDETMETWFEETASETDDETATFVVADGDDPVGYVELADVRRPAGHGDVRFCVAPGQRERGVGAAALDLLAGYAIEERRLTRVRAVVRAGNEPARRTLERVGFTAELTLREELYVDGEHHDAVEYALLADEWGDA